MTFQRSLFISIAMHILLFGSALAFAQYGHVLGGSDTITVMLVGGGSGAEDSLRKIDTLRDSESVPDRKTAPHEETSIINDPEETRIVSTTVKASTADNKSDATAGTGIAEQYADNRKSNGVARSQFGILTPDQWQIIEAALQRAHTYPRMARERGIEGVVRVRFKILPSGQVERVEILESSGSEILDSESVRIVYRSGPFPHVNEWIEIPISFHILK